MLYELIAVVCLFLSLFCELLDCTDCSFSQVRPGSLNEVREYVPPVHPILSNMLESCFNIVKL